MTYKDKGVLVLGVFSMSKEKEIRKYAKNFNLTYPVGKEAGIADALGAKGIPNTFFLDTEMNIVAKHLSTISYQDLENGIQKILADDL